MKCWSQTLCCLMAVACVDCAGTIDDPASFEAYASQARGEVARDAAAPANPQLDADVEVDAGDPTPPIEEDAGAVEPEPEPEPDAGAVADTGSPGPAPISCDFKALIMSKCNGGNCHGGPSAATGLDLTSDGLRERVANVSGGGACSDKPMINSADPAQSALYLVVTGNTCGLRMPLGGELNAAQQACVLEWISAGP